MGKDARLYAKFDLEFADNPKIILLSDSAFRAYVEAIMYSRRNLTDGFIDGRVVRSKWAYAIEELTGNDPVSPSWREVDGGFEIHDFCEHQTTRAEIEQMRDQKREAGSRGGRAKAEAKQSASRVLAEAKQMPSSTPSKTYPETETETETETITTSLSSELDAPTISPQVEYLLDVLDSELRANGARKLPARNKKNIDAARLLLDRDGFSVEYVEHIIRWAQADEFWRGNILSMSKLREKFHTLQMQSKRSGVASISRTESNMDVVRRLEQAQNQILGVSA